MPQTLSIVIPAYNEGATIHRILDKVRAVELIAGMEKELIIVNDCSRDNTEEAILNYQAAHPELRIAYYRHEVNQGKGAALHTGIKKAKGDFVIIQDAVWSMTPMSTISCSGPCLMALLMWCMDHASLAASPTAYCSTGTLSATAG